MQTYLINIEGHTNKEHIAFFVKWNKAVERAYRKCDNSLTRVSAGYYIVKVADKLMEIYKHENGLDWMVQEVNTNDSNVWEGSLSNYREYVTKVNDLYQNYEFKQVYWRDGSVSVHKHSIYNMGFAGSSVITQKSITIWDYLSEKPF